MESIKLLSKKAFDYLANIPPDRWSRHAFSTHCKSAMVLNNCCESFNVVIREAREKPILSMLEWIRRYIMRRMMSKREGWANYNRRLMPSIIKQLEIAAEQSRNCIELQCNVDEFEVEYKGYRQVVNLKDKTCGCHKWDLTGIPCCHALKCILSIRGNPELFVHNAYTKEVYAKTYAPKCHAMPGRHQWDPTPHPKPDPPLFKVMPGRPAKKKKNKRGRRRAGGY